MAGNGSIGTYYIQIEPSTGGMAKTIGEELDGGKAGNSFGSSFLDSVKGMAIGSVVGNLITAGLQMAADGAREIFTQAFNGFADYQQNVGGIVKLYGDASDQLIQYANDAYRSTGMSANQYMETATGFSAALLNSLGGNSAAAAEQTQRAMEIMSDNWNTFGGDLGSVQQVFQSLSRGQFQTLDNLRLGYAGTKEGMQQLIADANEWAAANGRAADLSIDNYSDMITAIGYIQEKQGIAGTTAKEAATTISGSLGMLSASWANFLTGLGNDQADMSVLMQQLVDSLAAAASNIIPVVMQIGSSALAAIPGLVSQAFTAIVGAIDEATGGMASEFLAMVEPIVAPLRDQVFPVLQEAWQHVSSVVERIMPVISNLAQGAMGLLAQAAEFLGWAFQQIQPFIGPVVDILGGALTFALQGVTGFVELLSAAFQGVADVVGPVIETILDGFEGLMEDLGPIFDTIGGFFTGLGDFIEDPIGSIGDFVFGTESAADTVESSAREMSRAAKQGYGQVATQAKTSATTVANSAKTGTSSALNSIRSNMDAAVGVVSTDTQRMSAESAAQFQSIHSSASTQWDAVRDTIGQAMSKASGSVQSSASTIQQTINGIKGRTIDIKAQTNDVGGIANSVKSVLNSIQSKKTVEINAYKTGINGVKVQKNLIGGVLDAIKLVAFAQGGIVSSPTMAVIGEAGYSEAVVPLSPNGMRPFASALAEQLDGGTRGVVINVERMEVRKESDIRAVASALNNMVNRQNGGRL